MRRRTAGFTLIDLMVTVAIIGILAGIAYPSYTDSVRKSRRAEAITALSSIALLQERWRVNHTTYAYLAACTTPAPGCFNIAAAAAGAATTESGYYNLVVTAGSVTGTAFSATATAVTGKTQTADKASGISCSPLTLNQNGPDISTQAACWNRN